jgi:hypothetical protein
VANVTIAKSRVLAMQVLRILSDTRKERPILVGVKFAQIAATLSHSDPQTGWLNLVIGPEFEVVLRCHKAT